MSEPIKLTVTKRTFNEAYLPYLYNQPDGQHRTMVFYGGAGSGKSKFVVQNAILKGLSERRKFLVLRKVDNTIRDSIFQEFLVCLEEWNILDFCEVKASYMTIKLPNKTEFIFKGLEDPERIKSIQGLTDIIMEEATEFTREDYDQLQTRLRHPTARHQQVFVMYNPASKDNWVYQYFHNPATKRPKGSKVICTTYKDNRFLPKAYLDHLQDLKNTNPVYYEIYALGKFASLGKRIYTNWKIDSEFKPNQLVKQGYEPRFGLDFGFSNDPTVILSTLVSEADRVIYVFDEFVKTGMIAPEIFDVIKRKKLTHQLIYADSANLETIEQIKRLGARKIKPVKKGRNTVLHGIQYLQGYTIYVHPRCQNTIKELENYEWKPSKGSDDYENVPKQNGFDHCMDALRYAVNDLIPRNKIRTINKSVLGL